MKSWKKRCSLKVIPANVVNCQILEYRVAVRSDRAAIMRPEWLQTTIPRFES
jgi:hypothetical protein